MREITVQQLMDRIDLLLDAEKDRHISPQQKLDCINSALARFYDFLISADLSDHIVKAVEFDTVAGTFPYSLATVCPDGDFYKLRAVYVYEGDNQYRPLPSVSEWYLQSYRPPQAAHTIRIDYIPCAPVLTSLDDTVDGVNGWEELIIAYAALELCRRRQEDPGWIREKATEIEQRITKMATRDVWFPDKVIRRRVRDPYNMMNSTVDGYRIRGGNIEIYRRDGYRIPV
jgi:hypothetical protein